MQRLPRIWGCFPLQQHYQLALGEGPQSLWLFVSEADG